MEFVRNDIERMLTPKEVREILQIGRTTMYKMIRNRVIPVRRIGKKWRIPNEAFRKWLQCHEGMFLSKPCWEIKRCSKEERCRCIIYKEYRNSIQ